MDHAYFCQISIADSAQILEPIALNSVSNGIASKGSYIYIYADKNEDKAHLSWQDSCTVCICNSCTVCIYVCMYVYIYVRTYVPHDGSFTT